MACIGSCWAAFRYNCAAFLAQPWLSATFAASRGSDDASPMRSQIFWYVSPSMYNASDLSLVA